MGNDRSPDGVHIVTPSTQQQGQQGLTYFEGISAQTSGSTGLCLHRLVVPPGGKARAHLHAHHESAIYVLSGDVRMFWGDDLQHSADVHSGDFIYIPAGVPHVPVNLSRTRLVAAERGSSRKNGPLLWSQPLDGTVPPGGPAGA